MDQYQNYEDNLFFCRRQLQIIREALNLELNFDIFASKLKRDLDFSFWALKKIQNFLESNLKMVHIKEHLLSLDRDLSFFEDILEELLNQNSDFFQNFLASYKGEIKEIQKGLKEQRRLLHQSMESISIEAEDSQQIISEQEYQLLTENLNQE